MNKTFSLTAEARTHVGHQVKKARQAGTIPGTVYGKGMESVSVGIPEELFLSVYKEAGETHLINLSLAGTTYPVLTHVVQKHPVTRMVVHVEFLKVNLKEKLKTKVPVIIVGESPAVKDGKGTLMMTLNEIDIEAYPNAIPEGIQVDVSSLAEVNNEVTVKDVTIPTDVTILTEENVTVAKISAIVVEKEQPLAAPETPEAEGDKEATAATETTPETSEEKE